MKKVIVIVFLIVGTLSLSGCFLFESGDYNDGTNNSNGLATNKRVYEIHIFYDEGVADYTFYDSNKINILPRTKKGYVFNGFYTEQNGNGTRMIDYTGKAVTNGWFDGCSMQLYPYYEEINRNFIYQTGTAWEEKPSSYSHNIYGDTHATYWSLDPEKSTRNLDYIYKVAYSDPDIQFKLTAYAEFRGVETELHLSIGQDRKTGFLIKQDFSKTTNFVKCSVSYTVSGTKLINNKDGNVYVGVFAKPFGGTGYVQNCYYQISIV